VVQATVAVVQVTLWVLQQPLQRLLLPQLQQRSQAAHVQQAMASGGAHLLGLVHLPLCRRFQGLVPASEVGVGQLHLMVC
jgi:hypothetical protein